MAGAASGVEAAPGVSTEGQEQVLWLVCEGCGFPLLSQSELIEEKFECWRKVTWAYELSVLGREGVWCYSATNAHDHRFDVVRALPSALGRSIDCRGNPTPEYSWFPGFSWSMAHCRQCGRHLGWGFSPDEVPPEPGAGSAGGGSPPKARKRAAEDGPGDGPAAMRDADASTGEQDVGDDRQGAEEAGEESDEDVYDLEGQEDTVAQLEEAEDSAGLSQAGLSFFGLVLTKMREKDLTRLEVDRRFQAQEGIRSSRLLPPTLRREMLRSLLRMVESAYRRVDPAILAGFEDAFRRAEREADRTDPVAAVGHAAGDETGAEVEADRRGPAAAPADEAATIARGEGEDRTEAPTAAVAEDRAPSRQSGAGPGGATGPRSA